MAFSRLKGESTTKRGSRVAAAGLAVAAVGGLAVAMPASASASVKSTQLEVCVQGPLPASIYAVGTNQNSDTVTSYSLTFPASPYVETCATYSGWWWAIGQSVQLHGAFQQSNGTTYYQTISVYIPTSAANGGTQEVTVNS